MDIYQNNMKIIKKNKTNLYDKIKVVLVDMADNDLQIEAIETKEDTKAEVVKKDGITYRLNSSYHPGMEAKIWAEQFNFDSISVIVSMFGLGNGVFVREALKRIDNNYVLMIYEPSKEIFFHVLNNYDLSDLLINQQIIIIVEGLNDLEFEEALNKYVNWTNINSLKVLCHPNYDKLFDYSYSLYINKIKSFRTTQVVYQNTAAALGKAITHATIYNIKYLPYSYLTSDYYKAFPNGVPAIIVGAGPSLDKNIEVLKKAKGKAVIFATDTSLKYLFAHNIMPDFFVVLDVHKSLGHFTDERCKNMDMLCSIEAKRELLDYHAGRKIFFNVSRYMESFYGKLGINLMDYSSGGSVSTACFSLCLNMGFQKIILIGQDLAYQGNETHAGGIIVNANHTGEQTLLVEDNNGNMIKSRYDWFSYIQWYNNAIAISQENGLEVINATEGGAKLTGAKVMTLSDAVTQYCKTNFDLSEMNRIVEGKKHQVEKEQVIKYIENSIEDLDLIKKESMEAVDICHQIMKAIELDQMEFYTNKALVQKIMKINGNIQEKEVYPLIDDYILSVTTSQLDEINSLSKTKLENQIAVYKRAIVIYKAIHDSIKDIKQHLEWTHIILTKNLPITHELIIND